MEVPRKIRQRISVGRRQETFDSGLRQAPRHLVSDQSLVDQDHVTPTLWQERLGEQAFESDG